MPQERTETSDAVLVGIVRDFLLAHQMLDTLVERLDRGSLRFEDIEDFVGDSERSILFRLKEHCHALFRPSTVGPVSMHTGELVDLAVGSLFHEAMKLRENLYQREVYVPRLEVLRKESGDEKNAVFEEFERILGNASERLVETFEETQALFALTLRQLRLLMAASCENGLVARFLWRNRVLASGVFPEGVEELFKELYGDVNTALALIVDSYLQSASFEEALEVLLEATQRSDASPNFERLIHYASGMKAFLRGEYPNSLEYLAAWLSREPSDKERRYVEFAAAAVSRIPDFSSAEDDTSLAERATGISEQIEVWLAR